MFCCSFRSFFEHFEIICFYFKRLNNGYSVDVLGRAWLLSEPYGQSEFIPGALLESCDYIVRLLCQMMLLNCHVNMLLYVQLISLYDSKYLIDIDLHTMKVVQIP